MDLIKDINDTVNKEIEDKVIRDEASAQDDNKDTGKSVSDYISDIQSKS